MTWRAHRVHSFIYVNMLKFICEYRVCSRRVIAERPHAAARADVPHLESGESTGGGRVKVRAWGHVWCFRLEVTCDALGSRPRGRLERRVDGSGEEEIGARRGGALIQPHHAHLRVRSRDA